MPPHPSPIATYRTLNRDVLDVVMSYVTSPQELANYAQTSRSNHEAAQQTELNRIVTELKNLVGSTQVGRRTTVVYNADWPEQFLPPGCKDALPEVRQNSLCCLAAAFGRLDWLVFLRGIGFTNGKVLLFAAGAGHLEIMKWSWENDNSWPDTDRDRICAYAMAGGHLPVLKWAREHGAPWPGKMNLDQIKREIREPKEKRLYLGSQQLESFFDDGPRCGTLYGANHVVILEFLFYYDSPPGYFDVADDYSYRRETTADWLLRFAYYRRNIGVVGWLTATGIPREETSRTPVFFSNKIRDIVDTTVGKTLKLSVQQDIINMLQWLHEKMPVLDFSVNANVLPGSDEEYAEKDRIMELETIQYDLFNAGKRDGNLLLYQWGVNNFGV